MDRLTLTNSGSAHTDQAGHDHTLDSENAVDVDDDASETSDYDEVCETDTLTEAHSCISLEVQVGDPGNEHADMTQHGIHDDEDNGSQANDEIDWDTTEFDHVDEEDEIEIEVEVADDDDAATESTALGSEDIYVEFSPSSRSPFSQTISDVMNEDNYDQDNSPQHSDCASEKDDLGQCKRRRTD